MGDEELREGVEKVEEGLSGLHVRHVMFNVGARHKQNRKRRRNERESLTLTSGWGESGEESMGGVVWSMVHFRS